MDITINLTVSNGVLPDLVYFGANTPVGEGGTAVDAPDGDYDSGNLTVSSNVLTVKSGGTPSTGTVTVGNTSVELVAGVSVATSAELQAWLTDSSDGSILTHTYLVVAQDITTLRADVSDWNGNFKQVPDDFIITGAYPNWTKPKFDYLKMQTAGTPAGKVTVNRLVFQYLHFYDPIDLTRGNGITNANYDMWEPVNIDLQGCEFRFCEVSSNFQPINQGGYYPNYQQNGIAPTTDVTGLWIHDCTFHNLTYPIRGSVNGALIEDNELYDTLGDFLNPGGGTSDWIIRNNDCRGVIGDGTVLHADFNQHQIATGTGALDGVFIFGNTATPGEFWNRAWPQIDATVTLAAVVTNTDTNGSVVDATAAQRIKFTGLTADRNLTLPDAASNDGLAFVVNNNSVTYDVNLVPAGSDTVEDGGVITKGAARYYSDGSTVWKRMAVGFAHEEIPVTGTKTLTSLYDKMLIGASAGADITLDSTATLAYIRKHDTASGDVTIRAPSGQTIEGGSSITISASGGARILSRTGTAWTVSSYSGVSMQGVFGNEHPDYDAITTKNKANIASNSINNYNVAGNVLVPLSPNGIWLEQPIPNTKIYGNTLLRPVVSDFDGDGTVTQADGWGSTGAGKIRATPYMTIMNNFIVGAIGLYPSTEVTDRADYPATIRDNVELSLDDNSTAVATLDDYLNGTVNTDYLPTTKEEVLTAALVKSGGSMPSNIGALGTTKANGVWDFVNKKFNLPTPAFTRVFPEQSAAGVPLDAVMFIEANVPLESLGTETLQLYNVTDAVGVTATFEVYGNWIKCTPSASLTTAKQYRITYDGVGIASYFENLSISIGNSSCDPVTFYDGTARLAPAIGNTDWTFTADTNALANKLPFFDGPGNDISQYADGASFALTAEQRFDTNMSDDDTLYLPSGDATWSVEVQDASGSFDLKLYTTGGSGANTIRINTDTGIVTSATAGVEDTDYGTEDINGDGTWWRVWIKGNGSGMTRFYLGVNSNADIVTVRRPMLVHSGHVAGRPYVVPLANWVAP